MQPPASPVGSYWQYQQPPNKSRKGLWAALGVLIAVVVVVGGAGSWFVFGSKPHTEEDEIRATVNDFAEAADTQNIAKVVTLLCADEAAQITTADDYDPNDSTTVKPDERQPVNITDVTITGDAATVTVTRPPDGPRKYRLVKEGGSWRLCNPGPVTQNK